MLPATSQPTEDDERQLQPDGRQSVEQEGRDDAAYVTQGGADRHAQSSVFTNTTISKAMVMPRRPMQATTVFNHNMSAGTGEHS
ncbi:hypothetical protein EYF80_046950 [Liparis tanakae]|uniref:Uncharacterized protein n=1 Tax=Liparis tanakae TaxID=230148 RepID=A0A4Z2FR47_9TELE|nr:hypothetical protein EYF80_046950 [Liparis tanakae]